ncbi:ethanolamine utilization microcompartment protein EutL [Klebsiella variicola]
MKSFNVPPVTLHGVGALAACGPQAQARGLKHLFVMVDRFLHQAGMTAGLERSLAMKGVAMTLWPCPAGEPCVTDVCAAVAQLRDARCDGVVAFGGGSVLDAAKAVALLVANPEQTLGEMTEHSELQPRLPLIAVPTTAGTGSETTNVTVIIDAVSGRKQVLAHASLMPDVAILDAALTEGVPPPVTAMTGIDALTHAVEAYSARHATPFTDSLAMGAIAMIGEALPKAVGCGQDLAARENMLLASCMAGMAFSSAGLDAMMAHIESGAAFQWANDAQDTAFLAHVVSRTGSYLSSTAGIALGDPIAYLVAPPLEATYGIDAAMKSADVQLVTYVPPPSETNYSAAFLTGSQAACKAACNAFTDAVLDIARHPVQRA